MIASSMCAPAKYLATRGRVEDDGVHKGSKDLTLTSLLAGGLLVTLGERVLDLLGVG